MVSQTSDLLSPEDRKEGPHNFRGVRIPPGTLVSFHSLKSMAHLNGTKGHIVGYDSARSRYDVCDANNERRLVKFANLKQHPEVKIQGLRSRIDLNGRKGMVLAFDRVKERWSIQVDAEIVSLKRENVIFLHGTLCKIIGLKSNTELNDTYATIRWKVDPSDTLQKNHVRYDLHLENGETVRVKPENIEL